MTSLCPKIDSKGERRESTDCVFSQRAVNPDFFTPFSPVPAPLQKGTIPDTCIQIDRRTRLPCQSSRSCLPFAASCELLER
jgi:hypothetical protein